MGEFTINGLRAVREVARTGSFSVAAQRLGYTQSAVSRQVSAMERAAGRGLFVRHARGVEPTRAGVLVAQHADLMLTELETAERGLQEIDEQPSGRVRLGAFSTAMAGLVPRALSAVMARTPDVDVHLREGLSTGLRKQLAKGRLDLAIVGGTPEPNAAQGDDVLLDDPLFVATAAGHPLAREVSVDPEALGGEPWIAASRTRDPELLGAWTLADWEPLISYVVKDWTAKIGLVASGLGVTVVPGLAVPALPRTVSVVRIDHPRATRPTGIAVGRSPSAATNAAVEALRDAAADLTVALRERVRR